MSTHEPRVPYDRAKWEENYDRIFNRRPRCDAALMAEATDELYRREPGRLESEMDDAYRNAGTAQAEMPKYQCHKRVHALKIKHIELYLPPEKDLGDVCVIHPDDNGYAPFVIPREWVEKHKPEVGGYYVVYDDGYTSYSPAAAFEAGYTRI